MIPALEELKPEEATEVLTHAAALVVPNPRVEPVRSSPYEQQAATLVERLKEYVGHKSSDQVALAKIHDILTSRLTAPYLTEKNLPGIRARLAERNLLPVREHKLVFSPFEDIVNSHFQVRHTHIEDAVYRADARQHLRASEYGMDNSRFPMIGLFAKKIKIPGRREYILLVICVYTDGSLTVKNAWRLFTEDLGPEIETSPLGLLHAFLAKYGMAFVMGNDLASKLYLYRIFPEHREFPGLVGEIPGGDLVHFTQSHYLRFNALDVVEVTFAYVINMDAYIQDLANHGIFIDASDRSLRPLAFGRGDVHFTKRQAGKLKGIRP